MIGSEVPHNTAQQSRRTQLTSWAGLAPERCITLRDLSSLGYDQIAPIAPADFTQFQRAVDAMAEQRLDCDIGYFPTAGPYSEWYSKKLIVVLKLIPKPTPKSARQSLHGLAKQLERDSLPWLNPLALGSAYNRLLSISNSQESRAYLRALNLHTGELTYAGITFVSHVAGNALLGLRSHCESMESRAAIAALTKHLQVVALDPKSIGRAFNGLGSHAESSETRSAIAALTERVRSAPQLQSNELGSARLWQV